MTTATNIPNPLAGFSATSRPSVQRLLDLAATGLVPMLDPATRQFCFRLNLTGAELVREGQSPRYTAITLLGLHRFQQRFGQSPIKTAPILTHLLDAPEWVNNIGDLGLMIWLCAQVSPEHLQELDKRLGISQTLDNFLDAQPQNTMELAWLLIGLCYWRLANSSKLVGLDQHTMEVYLRLKENQGQRGIFRHTERSGSLASRARGWIGSFADQVYPIYAMSLFASAYNDTEAQSRALQCGRAICDSQGNSGQWWWHYDSSEGRVIDGYPVFSVHQHAMAPMALLLLSDVTGHDFRPWIYKGLRWINSNNELDYEMEDREHRVIWRCIYRPYRSPARYLSAATGRYPASPNHEHPKNLRVLHECRPYELGWLLYAFAQRASDHQEI
jgi:hypothetical protein